MSRDFFIWQESMVYLRGSLFGEGIFELGLTSEPIRVSVNMKHRDIFTDDYGPNVPAEVLATLADATISMTLVHYDDNALRLCINHSMGGSSFPPAVPPLDILDEGTLGPAGQPLGAGRDISQHAIADLPGLDFAKLNRYITVSILSSKNAKPGFPENLVYRFKSCYLLNHVEIPLGVERSLTRLTWRAIPYRNPLLVISGAGAGYSLGTSGSLASGGNVVWDLRSRGVLLYDHSQEDVPVLL